LMMGLSQLGYGNLNKVDAINPTKYLVDFPKDEQDWS